MSTIRNNIIKALLNQKFISGESLAVQNGVTRSAISKHIHFLQQMGLSIFSVKGKGYQLQTALTLLNQTEIENGLRARHLNNKVEVFSTIGSTNDYLLSNIKQLSPGQLCVAEHQSAGRGRRGKRWQSPFGSHLYCSIYWPLHRGVAEAMGLSLVVGIAVAETLKKLYALDIQLKWPNDIYVNSRKLAGILVDIDTSILEEPSCIIGIGINVRMPDLIGKEIDQPWIDISTLKPSIAIDRNQLVIALIAELMNCLYLNQEQGFNAFIDKWECYDFLKEKIITINQGETQQAGRYKGIDAQGALIAEINGEMRRFYGGEISIREQR
jgi:BirA family biotin operon repressor/biotin-[acetyl-CoA-carboxylase] ligase